jgi:hypothetical protein
MPIGHRQAPTQKTLTANKIGPAKAIAEIKKKMVERQV